MAFDTYNGDAFFYNYFSYPGSWDWELEKESFKQISSLIEHLRIPPAPIVTNGRGRSVGVRVDQDTLDFSQDNIFMSDGSSYSRECWEKFCPTSIYVLDIWHLARHMWTCLGKNHRAEIVQLMDLAAKGDVDDIIRRLNRLGMGSAGRLLKEELSKLIHYIQENKEGLDNASKIKMPNLALVTEVVHFELDISEKYFDEIGD
jgi:hypothetical protein